MKNEPKKVAELIAKVLSDKKAENIVIIDVKDRTPFAEYYVLANALNSRHIRALIEEVEETLDKNGLEHKNIEGTVESGWMLLDALGVVINIFSEKERIRFNLDEYLTQK